MKIKQINSQHRRDFRADYECEHCGYIKKDSYGYDDLNFHNNVIPQMECPKCGKISPKSYKPLATKYPEGYVV